LVHAIEQGGEGCVGAHADLVYKDGDRIVRSWHMGEGQLRQGWMPGHPTLFLKREIYEKYGSYDTRYRCAADYEFMVRFLKDNKNRLAYVPETLVAMFYGGTSNAGLSNYLVSFREGYLALRRNGVKFPFLITVRRTLRVLRQF
jgi:glycosyltransferase